MKRPDLFIFLLATITLSFLVICSKPGGDYSYYAIYDDLPAIEKSDAAYLLNLDFKVTAENFADCIDDYFSVPARLLFGNSYAMMRRMTGPKKASAFADVFHNLPWTQIAAADYPWHAEEDNDFNRTTGHYCFNNAIGDLRLYRFENATYLRFCRGSYGPEFTGDETEVYFRAEGDPISELILVGTSLQEVSVEQWDNGL